jgi:predicted HTH domain antitoxin
MTITLTLPDDIAQHPDPSREVLEAVAIEGYRSGALTSYQARQLLGVSRFEFDNFLIAHNVHEHAYGVEDLEQEMATIDRLRAQGILP